MTSRPGSRPVVDSLRLDLVGPWPGHAFEEEQLPGWERPSVWYLTASSPLSALRATLGSAHVQHSADVRAGLHELEVLGITGPAAAAWLRTTATGVLHAKAVVADDESVFVTSANLTEAALDRNIELGLLVRDRPLALSVTGHFQGLVEPGVSSAVAGVRGGR